MKILFFIMAMILLISCGSTRKAVSKFSQGIKTSQHDRKDSTGSKAADSTGVKKDSTVSVIQSDSTYQREHTRIVREIILPSRTVITTDSISSTDRFVLSKNGLVLPKGTILRETKTTTKERGRKSTKTTTHSRKSDSSHVANDQRSHVNADKGKDTTANTVQSTKQVQRSGIGWYVWVVGGLAILGLAWWKGPWLLYRLFGVKLKNHNYDKAQNDTR